MKKLFFSLPLLTAALLLSSCGGTVKADKQEAKTDGEVLASDTNAIAETESGTVAGYQENGVYIYKGIPYAKAERFMPPQPVAKWEGIRSSRAYGPTCPQGKRTGWYHDESAFAFDWNDGFPDEDCLRVNIWTPGLKDGKKRPVMVWLHGGGYAAGSGQELPSYDGSNLAKNGDVVVVTLNHRLNALGFLDLSAFGDKYAKSGNAGLLDLVAALQWVNKNIASFGGDAQNVTIFGQSGGGGKVSTLLATPSAKGLFHKAIIQSGSMLRTMEATYSRRIGTAVVEELGLKPSQLDQLQTIPYEKLLAAGETAIKKVKEQAEKEGISSFIFGWAPTVDGDVLPAQPFDPQAPAQSKDIPVMIGTTLHEFTMSTYVPAYRTITKEKAVEILKQKYGEKTNDFLAAFEKAYPYYEPKDLLDVDVIFRPGAVEQARLKAAQQGAPVYMYLFTWESPVMNGSLRSTHCMEIPFVFDNVTRHASMTGGSGKAQILAQKMSSAWINFARTGNPNHESLPQWDPYTAQKGAAMCFDNVCEEKYNHDKELMELVRAFPTRGF
ncbi:carboxylesterase/lipase family protein [Macellibacteroides fermentans]|uniref:Carboxylic ester hydrolase n=1 Tax=Macellibacteroides fermentans TaxID=879969 RepID=A0A8E1ZZ37_9PORP|nr:carboxylesterase/lipase family protein [Macellibacteroides fermentans]NYI49291.1 para-nitrobenzyl esterase [Macellibacteroides fermentans]